LVEDQLRAAALPLTIELGLARKLTVGAGALTETVADCWAVPPTPVQDKVNVVFAVRAPVDCEPLVALLPDHPPEAVQEVALVEDQVRVALAPLVMALGPTLKVTVGRGALTDTVVDCVAVPPGPLHARV
jgi:hypothetical protein